MKKLMLITAMFMAMSVWSKDFNCTVNEVFTVNPSGELQEGYILPYKGMTFIADEESGNISGLVMNNISSQLCKPQVLSKGTSNDSFKLITNCGYGNTTEYLTIKTWSNNEFLAIANTDVVLTGSCK
jgi:hypothetical protein